MTETEMFKDAISNDEGKTFLPVCGKCGAVVYDKVKHRTSHEQLEANGKSMYESWLIERLIYGLQVTPIRWYDLPSEQKKVWESFAEQFWKRPESV